MDIKKVKLLEDSTVITSFQVTLKDGQEMVIPASPENRHYWEVREWYLSQKKEPFEFKFEELVEPEKDKSLEELAESDVDQTEE